MGLGPFYDITPQYGKVAYSTVSHSSAATADTIITTNAPKRQLTITSALDQDVIVTYNGADAWYVPANSILAVDLGGNNFQTKVSIAIGVYYVSVAPTAGNISVTAL